MPNGGYLRLCAFSIRHEPFARLPCSMILTAWIRRLHRLQKKQAFVVIWYLAEGASISARSDA